MKIDNDFDFKDDVISNLLNSIDKFDASDSSTKQTIIKVVRNIDLIGIVDQLHRSDELC